MAIITPIFRIFDYDKATEFYIDWLGFKIDWEHSPANTPLYMQISLGGILLHLSEHHGDATPGSKAFISDVEDLKGYHARLIDKNYKFNKPGLNTPPWDDNAYSMEVIDPFGNRLLFDGKK
jgi:catechol 2,3-dioxygenase-like lactoylglutathione lyase family enzyme